jgi:hypothetical protein
MAVSCLFGAANIGRRGQPPIRVSDAEQVRIIVVSNQRNYWHPAFAVVQRKAAPTEGMPWQDPFDTSRCF